MYGIFLNEINVFGHNFAAPLDVLGALPYVATDCSDDDSEERVDPGPGEVGAVATEEGFEPLPEEPEGEPEGAVKGCRGHGT